MQNAADHSSRRLARTALSLARLGACLLTLALLNGCAGLAVSLAGAGVGAGLSHQINGTATHTFTEPFDKVDNATRIASKRIFLVVDEVSTIDNGQVTKARVGELEITLELETLSPNLTRVSVKARRDMLRVDGATAQEIVVQIERALNGMELAEASRGNKISDARYSTDAGGNRKLATPPKKKSTI